MQYFDTIEPGEKNVLTFNLAPGLPTGQTLTGTPTVTVSVREGIDANPTAILNGAAIVDGTGTLVLQPIAPNVDGVV